MNGKRLFRHPTDRQIGGVAAGVAAWLDVDPTVVRVAWIILAIFTSGIFLLVYFVMLLVVPLPPPGWGVDGRPLAGPGGAAGAMPGAGPTPGAGAMPGAGTAPGGWQPPDGAAWASGGDAGGGLDTSNAGIVGGIVLIALGTWFLVDRYVGIRIDWALAWPIALMAVGGFLVVRASRSRPRT